MKKSMNQRIQECIKGRAEERAKQERYEEDNYTDRDYQPNHPDSERR